VAGAYYTVWLTLKDSDTVDEFYKYRGKELPEVGEEQPHEAPPSE